MSRARGHSEGRAGEIIVADVNPVKMAELLNPDRVAMGKLIRREE